MSNVIYAAVLLLLCLGGVVARKAYFRLPIRELKRRAGHGDKIAKILYKAAAYGSSLRALLWLYIGLTAAACFILLARELNTWISLLVIGAILWLAFSLVPAARLTGSGTRLAVTITPAVAWILNYLHPLLNRGADAVEGHYAGQSHTQLFERDDLVRLLERQRHQEDSRFTDEELEIAIRALSFDEHLVSDIMTPRKKIKTVQADDTVGPILIDELHKSGQEQALVREKSGGKSKGSKGPFIGTLRFSRLGIDSKGKVRDLMDPTVYYVHQNDTLGEALHAFFVTNHPVFVVVDSEEEYVGVISVEDVVRQLVGHFPGDDFDQYANPTAVAARHSGVRHKQSEEPGPDTEPRESAGDTPVKNDEEVLE